MHACKPERAIANEMKQNTHGVPQKRNNLPNSSTTRYFFNTQNGVYDCKPKLHMAHGHGSHMPRRLSYSRARHGRTASSTYVLWNSTLSQPSPTMEAVSESDKLN